MEVKITVEIQDESGQVQKKVIIGVPDDISKNELVKWTRENYSSLVRDSNLSVLVDWDNQSASGNLLTNGSRVIIRPRSTTSSIRHYKDLE